jgi:(2Fe-2S) ferredoxin
VAQSCAAGPNVASRCAAAGVGVRITLTTIKTWHNKSNQCIIANAIQEHVDSNNVIDDGRYH